MAAEDLEWPDYLIIAAHLVLTIAVGLWAARRGSRSTSKGYFLAGRDMSWWLVGMSLYVSNIGSSSFIGVAGAASSSGIAVICYELTGLFCIQLLGFVFAPIYHACNVFTMPEYVKKRFGGSRCQLYLAAQALILFVFTKLSAEIYAGALIIREALGWDLYSSVLLLLAVTAVYTVVGGLAAVIYTDALQTIVIIVGATILAVISMVNVGGYENMVQSYFSAVPNEGVLMTNNTCGMASPNSLHLLRPASDPDYPWPGVIFGANILSAWYFCTDQVLVQRLLAAKNTIHAKGGSILAGYMKVLPLFLMVWPGMIARIKFPEAVACTTAQACEAECGVAQGCSNIAYVRLVLKLMPVGLRGLMLAAMMAALMSSLTSIFNSGSTVFTMDIWKRFRKSAKEKELMIVSRVFVLAFVGVSVAWLPMVETAQGGQLFNYLQSISSYLAPPVLAVYLLGALWQRTNEQGAFWGLMSGLIVGVSRMIADWAVPAPACGQVDTRSFILKDFHFLHFAIFVFLFAFLVAVVVSYMTKPPHPDQLFRTTWWTIDLVKKDAYEIQDASEPRLSSKLDTAHKVAKSSEKGDDIAQTTFSTSAGNSSQTTLSSPLEGDDDGASLTFSKSTTKERIKQLALSWLCGGSSTGGQAEEDELNAAAADLIRQEHTATKKEPRLQSLVVRGNLIVVLCVGIFLWGFFA